jgi:hypothetical protein
MLIKIIFYLAEVLRAVTHLQVHHAIKLCEDFLIEETTVENCIDVLSLADLFSIPVLEKVCEDWFVFLLIKIDLLDK